MGRKPNTEVRREQIVEGLLQELSESGYERASIKSIAARAGLASGLVHYHFASKQHILLAAVDALIGEADRRFADALTASALPAERLAAFVTTRIGLGASADAKQAKAWIAVIAETMGLTEVRQRVSRWLARDQAQLTKLFADAGVDAPAEHAAAFLALILGSFSLHAIGVAGIPRGYAERQLLGWLRTTLPPT
jgi:TetR/AcrR family transcriptional repressor of bet genes